MRNKKTIFYGNKSIKAVLFEAIAFAISFVLCATFIGGIVYAIYNSINY